MHPHAEDYHDLYYGVLREGMSLYTHLRNRLLSYLVTHKGFELLVSLLSI